MTDFSKTCIRGLFWINRDNDGQKFRNSGKLGLKVVTLSAKEIFFPTTKKREMRKSNPKNAVKLEFFK